MSLNNGKHPRGEVPFWLNQLSLLSIRGSFSYPWTSKAFDVHGAPGLGKSVTLRLLAERLAGVRDVQVGVLSRPQARMADFYRELGDLFGVDLQPHNRWGGAKLLRERWQSHIDASLCRPVLIVDSCC